jgi:hypothetical protein
VMAIVGRLCVAAVFFSSACVLCTSLSIFFVLFVCTISCVYICAVTPRRMCRCALCVAVEKSRFFFAFVFVVMVVVVVAIAVIKIKDDEFASIVLYWFDEASCFYDAHKRGKQKRKEGSRDTDDTVS